MRNGVNRVRDKKKRSLTSGVLAAEYRRPESVLVVVFADDESVLLLKRIKPFVFWQSVTGSLEANERPEDAACRELWEETGLSTEVGILTDSGRHREFVIDPRWRSRYAAGVTENLEHEWHFQVKSRVDVCISTEEHLEWHWLPIGEAIEKVWSWTNKEALQAVKAKLRTSIKSV